jgi:hypothetical protein
MKKAGLVTIICLAVASIAFAQSAGETGQSTALPANARYEIAQSQWAGVHTLKLDRFSGQVDELINAMDGSMLWKRMQNDALPAADKPNRAHFQLFNSGLAAKNTFLLDTDTGRTWQLVQGVDKDGSSSLLWQMLPE